MILIPKSATPPTVLLTKGKRKSAAHQKAFAADRAGFQSGAKAFEFDRGTYASDEVKAALRAAQADKCAFCEAKVTHVTTGDVEHFRPKAAVKQRAGAPLERPGYFWLAYEWSNLLLACSNCNSRHKGNLFPLIDPAKRCKSRRGKLEREQPQFINPAAENPTAFITFVGETLIARDGDHRGQATIDALGLNRTELREHRLTLLKLLRQLQEAFGQLRAVTRPTKSQQQTIAEIQATLDGRKERNAEYSAMACCFLG
jgi:uncharacterized protein (TIGR02646 family)